MTNCVTAYRALLLSIALLVSACAPLAQKYQSPASAEQMLSQCCWKMRAKIGVQQQGKKHSAMLNWHQQQEQFTIRLNGPLGFGAVKLSGDDQQVVFERAGQAALHATSAEALLKQTTGIDAPLNMLKFWIRGQPAAAPVKQLKFQENSAQLQQFEQAGWRINLERYRQFGQYQLPGRVSLQAIQSRAGDEEAKLTLIISRWSFQEVPEPS